MSNDTVAHQRCLTPTEMKTMSSFTHFPPSDRYFSSVYKPFVHYIYIYTYCETLHYYVCIARVIYFKSVTIMHPDICFCTEVLHTPPYCFSCCLLLVQT